MVANFTARRSSVLDKGPSIRLVRWVCFDMKGDTELIGNWLLNAARSSKKFVLDSLFGIGRIRVLGTFSIANFSNFIISETKAMLDPLRKCGLRSLKSMSVILFNPKYSFTKLESLILQPLPRPIPSSTDLSSQHAVLPK